jgi:hypothetical protein
MNSINLNTGHMSSHEIAPMVIDSYGEKQPLELEVKLLTLGDKDFSCVEVINERGIDRAWKLNLIATSKWLKRLRNLNIINLEPLQTKKNN